MERDLFDNLTRAVANGVSRRSAIRALFGGGVAAVAGIGTASANAKPDKPGRVKPDCCPAERPKLCGFTCTNTMSDPGNCGSCGTVCTSGSCTNGVCDPVPPGPTCTDGIKNQGESDVDCGGINCPECVDGKICNSDADCQSHNCESGICEPAPTCTEADNGTPCDTGLMGICAAGTIRCDQGIPFCVQTEGPRQETCNGLDDDCDGQVDDGAIDAGQTCNTGLPGICATGTTVCVNGSLICQQNQGPRPETCNNVDDDCDGVVDNGAVCDPALNATVVCDGGCVYTCDEGFVSCDGPASGGCETDYFNDVNNCGQCGGVCSSAPPNATPSCTNGACDFTCNPGLRKTSDGSSCEPIPPAIAISVPDVAVGQTLNGTVTLRDTASAPTVVLLTKMRITEPHGEYDCPATVTIPAGSRSATFAVTGLSAGFGDLEAAVGLDRALDTFRIGTGF